MCCLPHDEFNSNVLLLPISGESIEWDSIYIGWITPVIKTLLRMAVAPELMAVFAGYCVRCQGENWIPIAAIVIVSVGTICIFIMFCFLIILLMLIFPNKYAL